MDFQRIANQAGLDHFHRSPQPRFCAALIAHLRREILFLRQLPHGPRFVDRLRERFLAKTMFAQPHRADRGAAVVMVRSRNRNGVDILVYFFEHLPVVAKQFGIGELLSFLVQRVLIDIAQGDDIAVLAGGGAIAVAFAADADARHVDSFVRAQNPSHIREGKRGRAGHQ